MAKLSLLNLFCALFAISIHARYVFYYDEYYPDLPNRTITAGIDHVIISSANPSLFTTSPAGEYVPFRNITELRSHFDKGTKVMISIGSLENTEGFARGAATDESRRLFAANVVRLCNKFGFDGVDINWKYPGGDPKGYSEKISPKKAAEIETFPILISEIRRAIGPKRVLSISTPAKIEDLKAYSLEKAPVIWVLVDWVNIITYDSMSQRDKTTKYHTDIKASIKTIDYFTKKLHLDPKKINFGYTMYAKYFVTDPEKSCETGVGCSTKLLKAIDGTEVARSGFVSFEAKHHGEYLGNITETDDNVCGIISLKKCPANQCCSAYGFCGVTSEYCDNCQGSEFGSGCTNSLQIEPTTFQIAMANGITDYDAGSQYYYDRVNNLFWSWDTPDLIARKFDEIVILYNLGGVVAWSLGQDSYDYSHILALQKGVERMKISNKKTANDLNTRIQFGEHVGSKTEIQIKPQKSSWWRKWWPK